MLLSTSPENSRDMLESFVAKVVLRGFCERTSVPRRINRSRSAVDVVAAINLFWKNFWHLGPDMASHKRGGPRCGHGRAETDTQLHQECEHMFGHGHQHDRDVEQRPLL